MAEIQDYPDGTPVPGDKVPFIADPTGSPAYKLADIGAFSDPFGPAEFAAVHGPPLDVDEEFDRLDETTLPSGWAWAGQGDSTYIERFGAGVLSTSGVDYNNHYLVRSMPAGDWTITASFTITGRVASYTGYGFIVRNSAGGNATMFRIDQDDQLRMSNFASNQIDNTTMGSYPSYVRVFLRPITLRLSRTSDLYTWSLSADGIGFVQILADADLSGHLGTPDGIGFAAYGGPLQVACHWFRIR